MICKNCKRVIPTNSVFCNWCGSRQIQEDRYKGIPIPNKNKNSYSHQIMVNGERITVSGKTEEEYYKNAIKIKSGQYDIIVMSNLRDAIDLYIDSRRNRLKQRTIEQYEQIRDNRFQSLMDMKLLEITPKVIDKAIERELQLQSRKGGNISARTVNDAYHLIKTVISKYTDIQLKADLPEEQPTFRTMLEPEQIYQAVKDSDIELPVLLAMWLGMSASEIRGLTKSKSIKGNKLYIVETVVDTKNGAMRKPGAKEPSRVRCYDIPNYIMQLINNVPDDIIEQRTAHALYMRLNKQLEKAGLPSMRFHDLRHVNTSTMAMLNIPMAVQQQRNGWASDSMPKRVYTHVFNSERQQADSLIDEFFVQLIQQSDATNPSNY